ncbi:hypothetical protein ACROYT_G020402 [Oculina patagonica]
MDWAMKYLPQRYREQMSDFYGKRGKSWRVACVILKSGENEYSVETVVHIFDNCTQDWFSVASILERFLASVKQEHSDVETAYLKSDNARCYHNASLILSLKSIGEKTGISIRRYDFSDPQSGKDVCDSNIAPMKGHMQRWVNEKHDIVTAADMKEALESYGGVRGCRNAVAEMDLAKAAETMEWKGISALFSFEFLVSGIRAWKAYAVGEGNKENPTKVAKEMRIARDGDAKLIFAPEEWRTAKQISSSFSRLAAAQRQKKAPTCTALIEEAENIDESYLEAWEAEKHLQELQTAVYEEVDLRHPIEYKGQDKRGMLKSKFNIAQLK